MHSFKDTSLIELSNINDESSSLRFLKDLKKLSGIYSSLNKLGLISWFGEFD